MSSLSPGAASTADAATGPCPSAPHTPGPWEYERVETGNFAASEVREWALISGQSWGWFARVAVRLDGKPSAEGEANARLIAAAPDLLEALRQIRDHVSNVYAPSPATVCKLCDEALDKAGWVEP